MSLREERAAARQLEHDLIAAIADQRYDQCNIPGMIDDLEGTYAENPIADSRKLRSDIAIGYRLSVIGYWRRLPRRWHLRPRRSVRRDACRVAGRRGASRRSCGATT
jgi:hypothetical protein